MGKTLDEFRAGLPVPEPSFAVALARNAAKTGEVQPSAVAVSHCNNYSGAVGVGAKVWESQNQQHSVGVGATYAQTLTRFQGHTYKGRPDVGAGVSYTFKF